jgi:nucleoside-diphosphate-sugar epimerase
LSPTRIEALNWQTQLTNIVLGAKGMVGSSIVEHLSRSGEPVVGVSRTARQTDGIDWIGVDLTSPGINLPKSEIVYCAADARISAMAIKSVMRRNPKRLALFSTTGVISKIDSSDNAEQAAINSRSRADDY